MTQSIQKRKTEKTYERLQTFLQCLEQFVDDQEQEAHEKQLTFFWDSGDVRRAILGMADFYSHGSFRSDEFSGRAAIVSCLGAEGLLGTIRLLRPHQAELGAWLMYPENLTAIWPDSPKEFWLDAGLPETDELKLGEFADLSASEQRRRIEQYAQAAESLFKFVGYSFEKKDGPAQRLARLYNKRILNLDGDDSHSDLGRFLTSTPYRKYLEYLTKKRPEPRKELPNINDAVALCLLEQIVSQFNLGESNVLPRFYCSSDLLRDAVEYAGRERMFYCKTRHGDRVLSALRSEEYYYFRVAFQSDMQNASGESQRVAVRHIWNTLNQHQVFDDPVELSKDRLAEIADSIRINGQTLTEVAEQYSILSFLQNVWIEKDVIQRLAQISSSLSNGIHSTDLPDGASKTAFSDSVAKAVQTARKKAQGAFDDYGTIIHFMRRLSYGTQQYEERFRAAPPEFDAFAFHGLNRFGIPNQFREEISTALHGQRDSIEGESHDSAARIFNAWFQINSGLTMERQLALTMAGLWSLDGFHKDNVEIYKKLKVPPSWAVAIAGSSAVNTDNFDLATTLASRLEQLLVDFRDTSKEESALIALSYLKFRIWNRTYLNASSRGEGAIEKWKLKYGSLVRNAINLIVLARETHKSSQENGVYATNLLVYFASEYGFIFREDADEELIRLNLDMVVHDFSAMKAEMIGWHYRFDDTLARYHLHMAKSLMRRGRHDQANVHFRDAEKHYKVALKSSYGDHEVISLRERFFSVGDSLGIAVNED